MTTLLALDTATEACSVALLHNNQILAKDEVNPRNHARRILPMIDETLAEAGITLAQVDALVFGRGPGSFTGVRIGCGIVQGLAFGADLPVIPISNLVAMAQAAHRLYQRDEVFCAIDARMDEVYFCGVKYSPRLIDERLYPHWDYCLSEQVLSSESAVQQMSSIENNQNYVYVGTGWSSYSERLFAHKTPVSAEVLLPSAQDMVNLAQLHWQQKNYLSAVDIEPIYLRNEVTWKKLPGRE